MELLQEYKLTHQSSKDNSADFYRLTICFVCIVP